MLARAAVIVYAFSKVRRVRNCLRADVWTLLGGYHMTAITCGVTALLDSLAHQEFGRVLGEVDIHSLMHLSSVSEGLPGDMHWWVQ